MTASGISEAVLALLREHLTSFERLEIALLLRAAPERDWDLALLGKRVRIAPELILDALHGLKASGLLASAAGNALSFRYEPSHPALAAAMDELAKAYAEQRTAILSLMSVNAIERIRLRSLHAFADSFVFNRKNKDD